MAEHNDAQMPPEQLGTVDHHLAYQIRERQHRGRVNYCPQYHRAPAG